MLKNYKQALSDFDEALKIDSDNVFVLGNRGETHRMLNNYEQALTDLDKALRIDPDDTC